jgi:hypothetical protein
MKAAVRIVAVALAGALIACGAGREATRGSALPEPAPNEAQREQVLRTVAGFKHLGFQVVAARLALGVDTALAWRELDTLLAKPTGDIFWMYPATGFYMNMRARLDAAWRARFRSAWKTYTPYRGDTENHFLMYYSSLLLMSQEWPDLPGSEWFNGKSSRENHEEARGYLEHWIDETVRNGSTEWDSPRYAYYYITPLILLRDFTTDEDLRRRVEMMLELTLADYAVEYLDGSYCGAHSRDGDGSVIDPRKAEVTSYGQLYFTDSISFVLPDLAYAAMSDWRCPAIIRAIATDRETPYVHTERKRSRAKMRYSAERYSTVEKYDYMTPDYCLGSIQGGLHQPIQQHSWDVTFAASKPNNTLFALHPTWSAEELGTYFPENPELMIEGVASAKASYTSDRKWIGGSPYESIVQERNTLVAQYAIPPGDPVQHVDLFVPSSADTIVRIAGWWFVRFGDAFTAVRIGGEGFALSDSNEGAWHRVRATRAAASADGLCSVSVTCARADDVTFATFVDGMLRHGASAPSRTPPPSATFDGPFVSGSGLVVELRARGSRRVLDFERGIVR